MKYLKLILILLVAALIAACSSNKMSYLSPDGNQPQVAAVILS